MSDWWIDETPPRPGDQEVPLFQLFPQVGQAAVLDGNGHLVSYTASSKPEDIVGTITSIDFATGDAVISTSSSGMVIMPFQKKV